MEATNALEDLVARELVEKKGKTYRLKGLQSQALLKTSFNLRRSCLHAR